MPEPSPAGVPERRIRIFIGIPAYSTVSAETLEDYMRFAYHIGRRNTEYDFFLGIKTKSEQFRARNSLVEGALSVGADYLFMLDDDHVIDWRGTTGPNDAYEIVKKLIAHKKDIIGALYYQRGGNCLPVLMKEGKDGGFYYMRDDQVTNGLQEVAVQGGGCMLIDMNVFSRIPSPWFEPEFKYGTDVQICQKARDEGYSVWCDSSIILGHVKSMREVVTPDNRFRMVTESGTGTQDMIDGGLNQEMLNQNAIALYRLDVEEYLGLTIEGISDLATQYGKSIPPISSYSNPDDYYKDCGKAQLARQVMYHHRPDLIIQAGLLWKIINGTREGYGLDFGCGSAPVGFEMAMRGHRIDFVDIEGTAAYAFTKWRARKRGIEHRCGWEWKGPYDYVMALDAVEHIADWKPLVDKIAESIKPDGAFITNFILNEDYLNPEHVNMDKKGFTDYMVSKGMYPINQVVWIKRNLGFMDRLKDVGTSTT